MHAVASRAPRVPARRPEPGAGNSSLVHPALRAAGFPADGSAAGRDSSPVARGQARIGAEFRPSSDSPVLASFLLTLMGGVIVVRSTILSIVLALAIGPGGALVCRASCDPEVAAANGCHHDSDGGATSVSSPASCHEAAPGPVAARTETAQRGAGLDTLGVLTPAATFRGALPTSSRRPAPGADPGTACAKRSRSIPLRI